METNISPEIAFENTAIAFRDKSNRELNRMYWLFAMMNSPFLVKVGTTVMKWAFRLRLPIKALVKQTIFAHFCGGETIQDCETSIQRLANYNIGTILDYSVEGEKNDTGFEATAQEIIRTIDRAAGDQKILPFCVFKVTGVASFDLMAKIQAQEKLSAAEELAWNKAKERVKAICLHAQSNQVRIFIDAEETWIQHTIDELAYEMMALCNKQKAIVYNTYQLYTKAAIVDLRKAYQRAVMHQYYLGAKIVRGAYMEKERERAQIYNYPDPIQPSKAATDKDFDKALKFCVEKKQRIALCAGSHNEYSNYYLTVLMNKYNVSPSDPNFYFAQLYGMSDHISYNLASAGYNVAKYVPYGPVGAVMPYLFRRAEENTSVAGQSSREFSLIKQEVKRRKQKKNRTKKNIKAKAEMA